MKILGLIVEYNPFHYGHIYHIEESKKLIKPDLTVAVMSGNFTQRGIPAINRKYKRAEDAIKHGVDLVIELPFVYAVDSADYFARGAIDLLSKIGCTDIVFGSESGNIDEFIEIVDTIADNEQKYNELVKLHMDEGNRYADATNQALSDLLHKSVTTPNDLLGLAYVKEVRKYHPDIHIQCISRTNDYHSSKIEEISSANAIRLAKQQGKDVSRLTPEPLDQDCYYLDDFYDLLKYKVLFTSAEELKKIHLMEEGLENSFKKNSMIADTMDEFINLVTSKRYTRARIQRTILQVLMHNTKKDVLEARICDYIHILKMNQNAREYIHNFKKDHDTMILTNFAKAMNPMINIELKTAKLLASISKDNETVLYEDYRNKPIQ